MHFVVHVARRRLALVIPMSVLALSMLAIPTVSAATPPITFEMDMFGPCVAGEAAADATVNVTWRDSAGNLKLQGVAERPYANDFWQLCATDSSTALRPGDKLKVSDGSYTRNYVVPNLTIHLDRVNDIYTGTGPAGRTIRLCISTGDFERCHSVRVGQDGSWSYSESNDDLIHYRIGFGAAISWTSPNDDSLNTDYVNAPFVAVSLGKAKFTGETDPGASAQVLLNAISSGVVGNASGDFTGVFRDAQGHPVKVMPGDRVHAPSIASDLDWIVPQVTGSADAPTDVVSGRCYDAGTSAQSVGIDVYRTGHLRGSTTRGTDSDGNFSVDMHRDVGDFFERSTYVKPGDRVVISCLQTTGDEAQLEVKAN
jgi:hypothetical protein